MAVDCDLNNEQTPLEIMTPCVPMGYSFWLAHFGPAIIFAALFGLAWPALASSSANLYAPLSGPSKWTMERLSHGEAADLDSYCQSTALDSHALDERHWADLCRQLPASIISAMMTIPTLSAKLRSRGVEIRGAQIVGDLNLSFAKLDHALRLENCRLLGNIDLSHARSDSIVFVIQSEVAKSLSAQEFHGDMSIVADDSAIHGDVLFENARLSGDVSMKGATVDGIMDADSLQVGGSLVLSSTLARTTKIKTMFLRSARIVGNVEMDGAIADGELDFDQLRVGASLFMRATSQRGASFQGIILRAATVSGNVEMTGARISKDIMADRLVVGGALYLQSRLDKDNHVVSKGQFQGIHLIDAHIGSNVQLTNAFFGGTVEASSLDAGANVLLRNSEFSKPANFKFAKVAINFDIRGAMLAGLDLSGATITRDFILADADNIYRPVAWHTLDGNPGTLTLRNARVGAISDSMDAWPAQGSLHLDGFLFAQLGGGSATGPLMRHRDIDWWDSWIQRDTDYALLPYEQLAQAFEANGDRDHADDLRYRERVQQRKTEHGGAKILDGFLQYVAGYGIGGYTFRVLYWVIGISALGGLYLWRYVPIAKRHGLVWCFGASLSRLMPVIELNKEFTDFFDDPQRDRLSGGQAFLFTVVGVIGWVLGAILVAAVSGLTSKS